jgi:hypothetical protein
LLTFTWGEEMPGGDLVLAALAETLQDPGQDGKHVDKERFLDQHKGNSNYSRPANSGLSTPKGNEKGKQVSTYISGILIGKMTPLEKAIMQSRQNMKKVMLAQATIQGVKVEGIATNLAVTKVCCYLTDRNLPQSSWRNPIFVKYTSSSESNVKPICRGC